MEEGDLFDHTYACQAKCAQDLIAKERTASKSLAASGKLHREDNSEQMHEADRFNSQTLVKGQEKNWHSGVNMGLGCISFRLNLWVSQRGNSLEIAVSFFSILKERQDLVPCQGLK